MEEAERELGTLRPRHARVRDELEDILVSGHRNVIIIIIIIIIIITITITTVLAQVSVRAGAGEAVTWAGLARSRVARRSVLLGCLLQATQQLAGINTVMYYAASILVMAGLPDTTSIWLAR